MNAAPYLVGMGGAVALLLTLLLGVYSLLKSISSPRPRRNDFFAPEAFQSQYTEFGYRSRRRFPNLSRLLAALLFRRT